LERMWTFKIVTKKTLTITAKVTVNIKKYRKRSLLLLRFIFYSPDTEMILSLTWSRLAAVAAAKTLSLFSRLEISKLKVWFCVFKTASSSFIVWIFIVSFAFIVFTSKLLASHATSDKEKRTIAKPWKLNLLLFLLTIFAISFPYPSNNRALGTAVVFNFLFCCFVTVIEQFVSRLFDLFRP